jgi:radical SAM protein with 4Fe4S-binding SPASM domain
LTLDARSIAATCSRINFDFYDVWDYFEEFKIKHGLKHREPCYIQVVKDVEDNTDKDLLILDMPEWETMLEKVFFNLEKQVKLGDFSGYEFMQYSSWLYSLNNRIDNPAAICSSCGADKNTCHLDIYGNLYPCHNMSYSNGHVEKTGVRAGGYNPYTNSERCGSCPAFILCGGGCIATPQHKFKYNCYTYYQQITRMLAMLNRLQTTEIGGIK